jgi:hypothetical protein
MKRRVLKAVLAATIVASALALTSCGERTLSPSFTPDLWNSLNPDSSHNNPSYGHTPQVIDIEKTGIEFVGQALIRAAIGGVITTGRHTLIIPPGALTNDVVITLKDVSGTKGYVCCEALPEGLKFQKAVDLITDICDLEDPLGYTVYWVMSPGQLNEAWIDVHGRLTLNGQGLVVPLHHFSTYAPGKAGWGSQPGQAKNGTTTESVWE